MNLIEYLKQQTIISKDQGKMFVKLLEKYEDNDVLYESSLEELDLTNEEFDELIVEMEKENYLDSIYIIQCPFCDTLGNTYVEKFDIPEFDNCRFCDEEFNHKENYITAYRLYFNFHQKIDIIDELSQKITTNQDRIFEIADDIKELETIRTSLQSENIKFVTLREELMYDKSESKKYDVVTKKYEGKNVKYIGTLLFLKKSSVQCGECGETFELFDIGKQIVGVCPKCGIEIEFVMK